MSDNEVSRTNLYPQLGQERALSEDSDPQCGQSIFLVSRVQRRRLLLDRLSVNSYLDGMSRLVKNVPIINSLKMSPFVVDDVVGMRTEAKPSG